VTFHDRRLDTTSPVGGGAWPTSKTEQGDYLVWNFGAQCSIRQHDGAAEPDGDSKNDSLFRVTECPSAIQDKGKK
jgi:hypothetical protein